MAKPGRKNKGIQRGVNKANVGIGNITAILDQQTEAINKLTQDSAAVEDSKSGGASNQQLIALKIFQAQLDLQKDANENLKRIVAGQNKQVEALQKGNKDWKGFSDKFKDLKQNLKESIDPDNIKKALFGQFSMFKGARDKKEDIEYKQRMKALGDTRKDPELKQAAKDAREAKEAVLRAQAGVDKLKKLGATDKQIQGSTQMADRNAALQKYNNLNTPQRDGISAKDAANKMGGNVAAVSAPLTATPSDSGALQQSTTDLLADQQSAKENQLESIRIMGQQTDLLQQIANNTGGGNSSAAGDGGDSGNQNTGGKLGVLGAGLQALGEGMKSIGGSVGKAIEGILRGLARGLSAIAKPQVLLGLGALTLAFMGIGKALQWAAPFFEAMAPVLMKVADVIGNVFIEAIKAIPNVIRSIGDVIVNVFGAISDLITNTVESVVSAVQRLSEIDGMGLLDVAAGITAIGVSLAAFGGGSALAGLGQFVGNFLSGGAGQSPIDKLIQLGQVGTNLTAAADGIDKIGTAIKQFAGVDKKSMSAINDFPWDKATAFVAAGGSMSVAGAKVENASKANADSQAKVDAQIASGGKGNTNVNQVNQASIQNTTVKPSVRNQESSQAKYQSSRY